jgi:membrane associated rhomboid family serine protease
MTKNPVLNALGASGYIVLVVSVMSYVSQIQRQKPDTFMAPLLVLFMLTLSVAVMAYMFFYTPLMLYIDGKKKHAVQLFLQTVGTFAAFTGLVLAVLFSGIIK